MIALIYTKREEIERLCREYGVARLEVFGSAADDSFDPETSDIDFLVEYEQGRNLGPWLADYFALRDALQKLLGTSVDLVMAGASRNRYFIEEMNKSRELVYAA
ncbi:MAG TPA: nucleotidyltransferase domain-containing protein [Candidatus Brocadiia bacterium]|nr:nucleotidyltransferase domain-containing protein [Candidatus Brocadiia bacterium]